MRALLASVCALALALSAGCDAKEVVAKTQVTVRISVNDPALLQRLTHLRIAIYREEVDPVGWVQASQTTVSLASVRWPLDMPVIPRSRDALLRRFEVIVDGLGVDQQRLAQARAITSYSANSLRVLEIGVRTCAEEPSGSCEEQECHGMGCRTCDTSATCGQVPVVDPNGLPPFDRTASPTSTPEDGGAPEMLLSTCTVEALTRCKGEASRQREQCTMGVWVALPACAEGQVCVNDPTAGATCTDPLDVCRGNAGSSACAGAVLHVCGPDGTSTSSMPCASARHCELGAATMACAACVPGEFRCTGSLLEGCDANLQWQPVQQCPETGEVCNARAGACTSAFCKPGGFSCGPGFSDLARCNAAGTAFDPGISCGPGLCDPQAGQCDTCLPRAKSCSENVARLCNEDGLGQTSTPCSAPRATCGSGGTCVECNKDADCLAGAGGECRMASCNVATGTCVGMVAPKGTPCQGGLCDGNGSCGYCGDAIVQSALGEQCDDGNLVATDECNECKGAACGDGKIQPGEQCDDGNTSSNDMCANCQNARCGDGMVQPGEQCDDGNTVDTDGCANCKSPRCGDGIVQQGEQCDDMNAINTDGCVNCQMARCGDTYVQAGREQCDDGNSINTDACANCQLPRCGDGFRQTGVEDCDDGNTSNSDSCTSMCKAPACGDGFVQSGEQCDDGNRVNNDACSNTCRSATCGDSIVQTGEACDDGNSINTDGCVMCRNATCGDGHLRSGIEDCEPGVGSWTTSTCSASTCKRIAYTPCTSNADCLFSETCVGIVGVCAGTCAGSTSSDPMGLCKRIPGFTSVCWLDYCAISCASGSCPSGLRCRNDQPLQNICGR